jgi:hypothetical protein
MLQANRSRMTGHESLLVSDKPDEEDDNIVSAN